jgi:hypothetical protein
VIEGRRILQAGAAFRAAIRQRQCTPAASMPARAEKLHAAAAADSVVVIGAA